MQRTLTNLLNEDKRVWLYFRNEEIWKIFCQQAEKEGFMWTDDQNMSQAKYDDIVALNNDMTFNYVGFVGHMAFNNTEDSNHYKIDFAKYVNGDKDYLLQNKDSLIKSNTKRRLEQRDWEYKMFEDD